MSAEPAPAKPGQATHSRLQFWLDVAVKLTVPLGAAAAGLLAKYFEQNRSNLMLINQREQAESTLRATMFGQLISPIAGPSGGKDIDPIRYAVLAQLLTLNFHEHFELRPLLQDSDDRLVAYQGPISADAVKQARSDLRSAAHRVTQRQIAKLWDDPLAVCQPEPMTETTFQFFSDIAVEQALAASPAAGSVTVPSQELKTFRVNSPDCRDTLLITFDRPDFIAERVHVLIAPPLEAKRGTDFRFDFDLTSFAFPFTDNALLPDGNRFAFFIRDVSDLDDTGKSKIMRVGLRWFPRNYYPPTERPTDFKTFKKTLGDSSG